ncbi:MAG TPA: hypothetical protein DC017_16605 [Candidatus Wallbacteria bacterium]|nr:hypothetical protein [Candidatus Wallbacteria bacterium]
MFLRKTLPLLICFFCGVFAIVGFFSAEGTAINTYYEKLAKWNSIIAAFAMLLGVGNLIRVNFIKITRNHHDKIYCAILIASLLITATFGILGGVYPTKIDPANPQLMDFFKNKCAYIFEYMMKPMQSTMFSLLAFFVASAAFRAFRAKSFEATILLVTAFIVMLGRVPIGTSIWPGFAGISEWILSTVNMAGSRAITLGAAVGATAACLKIILGLETRYLGGE